jgi:tetratricopeptide (TPR) repeat protein
VTVRYLRLAVWPVGLCFDYAWPPVARWPGVVWPSLLVVPLVWIAVWGTVKRWRWAYALVLCFLVLSPTSLVARPDPIMEYRMYLPLAGIVTLATALLALSKSYRLAVYIPLLAVCTVLTYARNRTYASAETLWRDVIRKRPGNVRAYLNLATALIDNGRHSEAAVAGKDALSRLPDLSRTDTADLPRNVRSLSQAEAYRDARLYAHAHNLVGVSLAARDRPHEAIPHFSEAVRLLPQFRNAARNLERARAAAGKEAP